MRGDWICGTCQYLNFGWRIKCQRCDESFVGLSKVCANAPRPRVCNFRPGDWFCNAGVCRAHNYASRRFCYKCGAVKRIPFLGGSVGYYNPVFPPMIFGFLGPRAARISRRGWRTGDWFCGRPDCNAHNFGDRVRCYKCNSLRELVSNTSCFIPGF
ncbi:hypothetical protein L1987_61344 [Smallanthus sonchifolius]|uniref:Uncharacterized protein n=1 Tax=Smallanthus sonchifolius TaxID=185202 RepID=A0ACB9DAG4_9ASTR|nr:hypothetical protein L1987_61344 [Smallanthus sonchifolius]